MLMIGQSQQQVTNNNENNEKLNVSNFNGSVGNVCKDKVRTNLLQKNSTIQTKYCTQNEVNIEGSSLLAGTISPQSNSPESDVESQQSSLHIDEVNQKSLLMSFNGEKKILSKECANGVQAEDNTSQCNSLVEAQNVQIEIPVPKNKLEKIDYSASRCGLRNLGNTCYLNSALQMLYSLNNGFILDLLSFVPNQNVTSSIKTTEEIPLHSALVEIAREIFCSTKTSHIKGGNTLDPAKIKSVVDKKVPQFVGYRQHDSHEFLITLLDLLHEEVKEKVSGNENDMNEKDEKRNVDTRKTKKRRNKKGWRRFSPLFRGGKRVSSFSQLDAEAISDLLHGSSNDENTNVMDESNISTVKLVKNKNVRDFSPPKSWASIVSSTSVKKALSPLPTYTLAGGRAPVSSSKAAMSYVHTVDKLKIDDHHDKHDSDLSIANHKLPTNHDTNTDSVETTQENQSAKYCENDGDNHGSVKTNDEDESVGSKSCFH